VQKQENTSEISTIINQAGNLGPIPEGLTVVQIIEDPQFGRIKIRAYETNSAAQQQETLLKSFAGQIQHPQLIGRSGNCLVFQYPDFREQTQKFQDPDFYFQLGKFLGLVNSFNATETTYADLDQELEDWLDRFVAMCLIPKRIADRTRETYYRLRPTEMPICIDYWDAMPHNFAWEEKVLFLLDEKHLRPSYIGVGLVKPMFLLDSEHWGQVRQGYESVLPLSIFDQNIPFLEFYYLLAAIYFYSLIEAAGRVVLATNPRFLSYRDRLIDIVTEGSLFENLLAELQLYSSFPSHLPALVKRRISHNKVERNAWHDELQTN